MRGINIIGVLVGIYLLSRSYLLVRRREEDVLNFLVWLVVGVGLIVAGFFPDVFNYIMKFLGMETRAYAMFVIGIFILYLLLFRVFSSIRKIERNVSKINEEVSLMKEKLSSVSSEAEKERSF